MGFLAVSHRNLTEGYRLFLGSIFIVKLESLFKNLTDSLGVVGEAVFKPAILNLPEQLHEKAHNQGQLLDS
jgi:hypothetical protein